MKAICLFYLITGVLVWAGEAGPPPSAGATSETSEMAPGTDSFILAEARSDYFGTNYVARLRWCTD
jgi:hypothetical protein